MHGQMLLIPHGGLHEACIQVCIGIICIQEIGIQGICLLTTTECTVTGIMDGGREICGTHEHKIQE